MRRFSSILAALALVTGLQGAWSVAAQTADSTSIRWTVQRHGMGIQSPLRATAIHRLEGVAADSVWLALDGYLQAMKPGMEAGCWFVVVPEFREGAGVDGWDRWPNPGSPAPPSAVIWSDSQRTIAPLPPPIRLPEHARNNGF